MARLGSDDTVRQSYSKDGPHPSGRATVPDRWRRALLPQAPDAVGIEQGFVRDQLEVGAQGLCDQHSVEGVAVRAGQAARTLGVVQGDGEFGEALGCDAAGDVARDLGCAGELAEAVLGGDLPG